MNRFSIRCVFVVSFGGGRLGGKGWGWDWGMGDGA